MAKSPKGFILTKDITEVRGKTSEKIGSKSGKGDFVFEVVTKARTYYFAPEEAKAKEDWMAAIKSWIGYNEDVSTKEQPKPGDSKRASQTVTAVDPTKADAAAAGGAGGDAAAAAAATPAAPGDSAAAAAATTTMASDATSSTAATTTSTDATSSGDATPAAAAAATGDAAPAAASSDAGATMSATPDAQPMSMSNDEPKTDVAAAAAAAAASSGTDEAKANESAAMTASGEGAAGHADIKAEEEESKIVKYESQYDYDANEENELSFKEGDIVTVLDTFKGAGWWKAELNGKIGLIPGNFFVAKK